MKFATNIVSLFILLGLSSACSESDLKKDSMPVGTELDASSDATDVGTDAAECEDDCQEGEQICNPNGGFQVCGHFDADDCVEFSQPIACPANTQCDVDRCVPNCIDECAEGTTACLDDLTVGTCGNFDADVCLELGAPAACGTNERCEQGECVDASAPCVDECNSGESVCAGNAVQTCGQHDSDNCLDLGPSQPCAAGETCANGMCNTTCTDTCSSEGATECSGDGLRTCVRAVSGCLAWSTVTACPAQETCSNGMCTSTCQNECSVSGESLCTADGTAVTACGQYDSDPCLDRSTPVPCSLGQTCSNGACVVTCVSTCTQGTTRCVGNSLETCGNYDSDPCLEWGGLMLCPNGATCSNNVCGTQCGDECSAPGDVSCLGNGIRTCGQFDVDPCLDWSSVTNCQSHELCSAGVCTLGPTPATIILNEIVYDSVGPDSDPGNNLFVELKGPPGTSLNGFLVVGVNGADNLDYNLINLSGRTIAADGYFLIAHPNGSPGLVALADMTSTAVDFQNGPDSVQVRWYTRVVDALGYGSFGTTMYFAGEGSPSQQAYSGASLTRDANSADYNNNSRDFFVDIIPTPRQQSTGCTDQCGTNHTRCDGTRIQTCGDFDIDSCLEWSAPSACPGSTICTNGVCGPPCTDECTLGEVRCSGNDIQTCGNFDSDGCYEWEPPRSCGTFQYCFEAVCRSF